MVALLRCVAIGALTLSTSGCLQLQFERSRYNEPIQSETSRLLLPGIADLEDCLDVLGAPNIVREQPGGAALAWGWGDTFEWGLSLSYSFGDGPSASVKHLSVSQASVAAR